MYKVVITRTDGVKMEFKAINFQAAVSLIAGVTAAVADSLADWCITTIKDENNETQKK